MDRAHLTSLLTAERNRYRELHPGSFRQFAGADHLFTGVPKADIVDVGGIGGTLAGNALSMAAARATLEGVLTDVAFTHMCALAERLTDQVARAIDHHGLPWSVVRLGARSEYRFCSPAPVNGTQSARSEDPELNEYLHLFMSNRGVLITPFHNMVLMCPETTTTDVDLHERLFEQALDQLVP
jgi:glutamate-1-semialdehyde 2,1-aminomutase